PRGPGGWLPPERASRFPDGRPDRPGPTMRSLVRGPHVPPSPALRSPEPSLASPPEPALLSPSSPRCSLTEPAPASGSSPLLLSCRAHAASRPSPPLLAGSSLSSLSPAPRACLLGGRKRAFACGVPGALRGTWVSPTRFDGVNGPCPGNVLI